MEPEALQKQIINSMAENCISARLRLMNRIVAGIFDEALRPHEIKVSQLTILVIVAGTDNPTSKELCGILNMDTSTFSRALTRMKKNRWLDTEPSGDGKILNIKITSAGLKKLEAAWPDWQKAQEKATEVLGDATAQVIISSGTEQFLSRMKS